MNITDPLDGGTSADLPYNFMRELQVKEGGYEAEYGRATGGIVNIITYSGGNHFGGQVFGFYTNDRLTAEPRFANLTATEPSFSAYDVGGSLGGPDPTRPAVVLRGVRSQRLPAGAELPGSSSRTIVEPSTGSPASSPGRRDLDTDVMLAVYGDPRCDHMSNVNGAPTVLVNPDPLLFVEHQGGLVLTGLVRRRLGSRPRPSSAWHDSPGRATLRVRRSSAARLRTYVDNPAISLGRSRRQ